MRAPSASRCANSADAPDGDRLGEGVAADGELREVEIERLGVEVDGAVQIGDGDSDVVSGWIGHGPWIGGWRENGVDPLRDDR